MSKVVCFEECDVVGGKIIGEDRANCKLRYFYDVTGLKRMRMTNDNGTTDYEYVKDSNGSIIMLVGVLDGKIACQYEYDALGNCKIVYQENQMGEINPFKWKGFFHDSETGFYYANGSYYDPETGLYVDAAPISTVFENAGYPKHIDRNGTLCYNTLAIAGSPYTVSTTVEMTEDLNYDPGKRWWEKLIGHIQSFLQLLSNQAKVAIGMICIALAVLLTCLPSGEIAYAKLINIFVNVCIGIGTTAIDWTIRSAVSGEWNFDELKDALSNTILVIGVLVFISTAVSVGKYFYRSRNSLAGYELDPRSIELAKEGNPSWEVFRKRVWQNEAKFRPEVYRRNIDRMLEGKAPIVRGKSMHLHHVVGKSNDLYNVIKVTQAQHIAIHKAIGYHYNVMWTLENAIKYGGLS